MTIFVKCPDEDSSNDMCTGCMHAGVHNKQTSCTYANPCEGCSPCRPLTEDEANEVCFDA